MRSATNDECSEWYLYINTINNNNIKILILLIFKICIDNLLSLILIKF